MLIVQEMYILVYVTIHCFVFAINSNYSGQSYSLSERGEVEGEGGSKCFRKEILHLAQVILHVLEVQNWQSVQQK